MPIAVKSTEPLPPVSRDDTPGIGDKADAASDGPYLPRIEGFQIVSPLGSGGMGTVYRAIQLTTGRTVALKLLRGAAFGSPRALARFHREVELLGRLEHPHIARLYYSGEAAGCGYFAMELVEGEHLDEYARGQRLTPRQVLELMVRVCRAVGHAHQRGVIHRDLKPTNVLVDKQGQPHVLDFGLAKLAEDESEGLTGDGAVAGTPHFMSPEQASGHNDRVDTRSDVYSLGVILYRLLTHRLPHPPDGTSYEVQRAIVEGEPPRPRCINASIGRDLEAVVLKALAKDSQARYSSAEQLADDLEHYLRAEPVRARKLTAGYFLVKWVRRHWVALSVALGVLLVLSVGAVASYVEVAHQRDQARAHAKAAEHALYLNRIALARAAVNGGNSTEAMAALDRCPPDLRKWEWHYLRKLADSSSLTLIVDRVIRELQVDREQGDLRAVGAVGLTVWDVQRNVASDAVWESGLSEAELSADGEHLLVTNGSAVAVHDAETGALLRRFTGHDAPVQRVETSSDGLAVSIDINNRMLAWSPGSGERIHQAQSLDHVAILAVDRGGTIAWVVDDGLYLSPPDGPQRRISLPSDGRALAFGSTGPHVWVGGDAGYVTLVDMDTGGVHRRFEAGSAGVVAMDVSKTGEIAAVGAYDGRVYLLDLASGAVDGPLHGLGPDRIRDVAFVDPEGTVVAAAADRTVKVWRLPDALSMTRIVDSPASGPLLRFRSDSAGLLWTSHRGGIEWTAETSQINRLNTSIASSMAYGPDGQWIEHRQKGPVVAWLPGEPAESARVLVDPGTVVGELSGGGHWFVTRESHTHLAVYDLGQPESGPRRIPGRFPAAIDPAESVLASVDPDDPMRVRLWSLEEGRTLDQWAAQTNHAGVLAFSGDGRFLASVLDSGIVQLWRLDQRQVVATCPLESIPHGLSLNRDGSRLLVAGNSKLSLVDTWTGERLLDLLPPGQQVLGATFSPDDRRIAASTTTGLVLWSVP